MVFYMIFWVSSLPFVVFGAKRDLADHVCTHIALIIFSVAFISV